MNRKYLSLAFSPIHLDSENAFLATSVVKDSVVSSVGQEVGTEVTFTESSFANNSWESGE